jgi:hypothetical protein
MLGAAPTTAMEICPTSTVGRASKSSVDASVGR